LWSFKIPPSGIDGLEFHMSPLTMVQWNSRLLLVCKGWFHPHDCCAYRLIFPNTAASTVSNSTSHIVSPNRFTSEF